MVMVFGSPAVSVSNNGDQVPSASSTATKADSSSDSTLASQGTEIKCIAKPSSTGNVTSSITISFDGKSVIAHGVSELTVTFCVQPAQAPPNESKVDASAEVAEAISKLDIQSKDEDASEVMSVLSPEFVGLVDDGDSESNHSESTTEQSVDQAETPRVDFTPYPYPTQSHPLSPPIVVQRTFSPPPSGWADMRNERILQYGLSPVENVINIPRSPLYSSNAYNPEPAPPMAPRMYSRPTGTNRFGRQWNSHSSHNCFSAPKYPRHRSQPNFTHQKSQAPLIGGIAQHSGYRSHNIGTKVPPVAEAAHPHSRSHTSITNPITSAPTTANNSFYSNVNNTARPNSFQAGTGFYDGMTPLVETANSGPNLNAYWANPNTSASTQPTPFPHYYSTGMHPAGTNTAGPMPYSSPPSNNMFASHSDLSKFMNDLTPGYSAPTPCGCF